MVQWSGEDSTSGLAAYDVQVRVDGGAWQDWQVGVTGTSGVYVGILGHTYAFRSRGHDRAGNVEAWPAVPDAETRVVARVRKTYIFGGMPVAVRLHPERGSAGVLVYLHLDHLGSPVVATDGGGDVVAEVRYYPYGGMRVQIGEMPTTLNFTGQRLDAGVGLLYYRARYYDPVLGRFVQPDTVVPEPGDPQQLCRFGYARNNSLRYTDQTGHFIEEWTGPTVQEAVNRDPKPVFFTPALAERAWGVREAMRVSRGVDAAENVGSLSDAEFLLAATSPFWAAGGALLTAGVVEAGAPLVTGGAKLVAEGAKAAWPIVEPILAKAATGAGVSAVGDAAGQFATTGTCDLRRTAAAAGAGALSSFIPGGEGLLSQLARGIGIAEVQLGLTNLAAGEPTTWEGITAAGVVGGLTVPVGYGLGKLGLDPEAAKPFIGFLIGVGVETSSNIGQSLIEKGLNLIR